MIKDLALACHANGIVLDIEGIRRSPALVQIPPPVGVSKQLNQWLDEYGIATR